MYVSVCTSLTKVQTIKNQVRVSNVCVRCMPNFYRENWKPNVEQYASPSSLPSPVAVMTAGDKNPYILKTKPQIVPHQSWRCLYITCMGGGELVELVALADRSNGIRRFCLKRCLLLSIVSIFSKHIDVKSAIAQIYEEKKKKT